MHAGVNEEKRLQPQRKKHFLLLLVGGFVKVQRLWRAVASLLQCVSKMGYFRHRLIPLPRINYRTIMQTIYAHATDTKKKPKSTYQFHCVKRCGRVWFRDVLLWYDRGWISVLVVLKKQFHKHNRQKHLKRRANTLTVTSPSEENGWNGLQSINIIYYLYIFLL